MFRILPACMAFFALSTIAFADEPKTAEDFASRGNTFYGESDYDKAIEDFDEAIRLEPSLVSLKNHTKDIRK
jgi:tetratricopeptide (TPR) repeat protein